MDTFDTRSGISAVKINNGKHSSVIMSVLSASGSFLTSDLKLENPGRLILLSPGGIFLGDKSSFTNLSSIGLTTQDQVKVGRAIFSGLATIPDQREDWGSAITISRKINHSNDSKANILKPLQDGDIELDLGPDSFLSVSRHLLIDSGNGNLKVNNGVITAGEMRGERDNSRLTISGENINLTNASLAALSEGRVAITALSELSSAETQVRGLKVYMGGEEVTIQANSRLESPRGFIQVEASKQASILDSEINISPQVEADVLSEGLGFIKRLDGFNVIESTPGRINISTSAPSGGGVTIENSQLKAGTDLTQIAGVPASNSVEWPAYTQQEILGGNIIVVSPAGIQITKQSRLESDSSHGDAGMIALFNLSKNKLLAIRSSTVSAEAPAGSGDIVLTSDGGIAISESILSTNTSGTPLLDSKSCLFCNGLFPQGEIRLANTGKSGINIKASTLQSTYNTKTPTEFPYAPDDFDDSDDVISFAPGGLISLKSSTDINISDLSWLNASSDSGFAGRIEVNSQALISVNSSILDAQILGDGSNQLLYEDGTPLGRGGMISIRGKRGIDIVNGSSLHLSSNDTWFSGQTSIVSDDRQGAGINIKDSAINANSEYGQTWLGGLPAPTSLLLTSAHGISIKDSEINKNTRQISYRYPASNGTIEGSSLADTSLLANGAVTIKNSFIRSSIPTEDVKRSWIRLISTSKIPVGTETSELSPEGTIVSASKPPGASKPNQLAAYNETLEKSATVQSELANSGASLRTEFTGLDGELLAMVGSSLTDKSVDRIIDNRDPTKVTVTSITQTLVAERPSTSEGQNLVFDTRNEQDLKALRNLINDDEVFASISAEAQKYLQSIQDNGVSNQNPLNTPVNRVTSIEISQAVQLNPIEASDSLLAAERRAVQLVGTQLGRGASAYKTPEIPSLRELQNSLRAATKYAQQKRESRSSEATASTQIASAIPTGLGVEVSPISASESTFTYKPAIMRLSLLGKKTKASKAPGNELDATSSNEDAIDIVILLPEGEPVGWRVSIDHERMTKLLRNYFKDLSVMSERAEKGFSGGAPTANSIVYDALFSKARQYLEAHGITALLISADPELIDLPFASLEDENGYLTERLAISITPSLAYSKLQESLTDDNRKWREDFFGASSYTNGLSSLPFAEQEVLKISQESEASTKVVKINEDFTRKQLTASFSSPNTKRIHIAAHADIAAGQNKLPIIYSKNEEISLNQLASNRLNQGMSDLDLVTLSACRTAVSADELELGFASLAIQLGAKSAIGTKWYVDDLASSALFILFYRYLGQGLTKDQSLQAAQQDFANGRISMVEDRIESISGGILISGIPAGYRWRYRGGFTHPYYWAGMQLLGNPW